jgi:hypothetical protein
VREAIKDIMQRELTPEERRHPWEAMIDAYQRLDAAMRGGTFHSDEDARDHAALVLRMGKILAETRAIEKLSQLRERLDAEAGQVLANALAAGLDVALEEVPVHRKAELRKRALDAGAAVFAHADGGTWPPVHQQPAIEGALSTVDVGAQPPGSPGWHRATARHEC